MEGFADYLPWNQTPRVLSSKAHLALPKFPTPLPDHLFCPAESCWGTRPFLFTYPVALTSLLSQSNSSTSNCMHRQAL